MDARGGHGQSASTPSAICADDSRGIGPDRPSAPARQPPRQRARRRPLRRTARHPRRDRSRRPSRDRRQALPFPIEVIAFADEEGLRFQTTYLGSSALAGSFDPAFLDLVDADGMTLREAMADVRRRSRCTCRRRRCSPAKRSPMSKSTSSRVRIWSRSTRPLGVVTAISGQTRILAAFTGEAGHAGTVAMHLRRDPLPAAAEIVLAAEDLARQTSGLLATVGTIEVAPGASNVIPGQARFSLDVRHPEDAVRGDAVSSPGAASARDRRHPLAWRRVEHCAGSPRRPL